MPAVSDPRFRRLLLELVPCLAEAPPGILYGLAPKAEEPRRPRGRPTATPLRAVEPPPCLLALLGKAARGEEMEHWERFALAAMLRVAGVPPGEAVKVFRLQGDFDERVARYQVEHVYGLRGGGKKYAPYSCARMRELGMCPRPQGCTLPSGGAVRNPAQLVRLSGRVVRGLVRRMLTGHGYA